MIKKLKSEFPNKVVIASIMGRDNQEWEYLAKEVTKGIKEGLDEANKNSN